MTTATQTVRYLTCAETAKLVRQSLRREFPAVKFSVRSSTYSGGASIHVEWTDGPTTKAVDRIAGQYAGSDFDGMIDLKTGRQDWLSPEGRVLPHRSNIGHSYGETRHFEAPGRADAQLVHFGADYVFTRRNHTDNRRCPCGSSHSRAELIEQMRQNEDPAYPSKTVACRGCREFYYNSETDTIEAYA